MLFNSIPFLVFYPVVTLLYFILPQRWRWAILLAASATFYMAFVPSYILILFFTILVDYNAGLWIERSAGHRRRFFLVLSLVANIGVLAFFKYFNFMNANLRELAHFLHWNYPVPLLQILLPIGLSFHTFQSMSYTVEVYRGRQAAEKHLGILALYVLFYPQLVAGPIERPQNLIHQFREVHRFDEDVFLSGVRLMLWGLFKKCVIADRLALYVSQVYDHPFQYRGLPLLVATVFFSVQIYCDFSGYSDVAIGSARSMGFRLMQNFNRPYGADSVPEFWRRWHISLSTFFRDYLYIPLGGNRTAPARWCSNIMLTFLISGLWHGAAWNYILWGGDSRALHDHFAAHRRITQGVGRDRRLRECPQRSQRAADYRHVFSDYFHLDILSRSHTFRRGAYHDASVHRPGLHNPALRRFGCQDRQFLSFLFPPQRQSGLRGHRLRLYFRRPACTSADC